MKRITSLKQLVALTSILVAGISVVHGHLEAQQNGEYGWGVPA